MFHDPFGLLERMRARHGRLFTLKALSRPPLVFVADPEEAAAVFAALPDVLAPGEGGNQARWSRFLRERDAVDATLRRLVEERRTHASSPPGDALDLLLAAREERGGPLSAAYVRDSLMSLILAGHETTTAELSWVFQLLAYDSRVQRTLHAEVDAAEGTYLTATIQEALRHRPVFLFAIPRAVKQPIEIGDWTHLPPAQLLVCLYLLHHDPALFADPQRFTPERFLDAQPDGTAWLPWGGGRRRCLGWRLAFLELQTIVAATLARYAIEPAHPTPERPRWRSVIVTPHRGCRVILHQRSRPSCVPTPK